jgi:lactoylglutathione lyase
MDIVRSTSQDRRRASWNQAPCDAKGDPVFDHVDYIMITVSNMARSVAFYREALGLRLRFESEMWSEFETGATTLALHGGGTASERPAESATEGRAGACSIGFAVTDIAQTVADLRARGVSFSMPPTAREGEGITLAICTDPDGLPISIVQLTGPA